MRDTAVDDAQGFVVVRFKREMVRKRGALESFAHNIVDEEAAAAAKAWSELSGH